MSVVNKMLQDLESRQYKGEVPSADYSAPKNSSTPMLILLFVIIAIVASASYWWFADNEQVAGAQTDRIDLSSQPPSTSNNVVEKTHDLETATLSQPLAVEPMEVEKPKVDQSNVAEQTVEVTEELVKTQSLATEQTPQNVEQPNPSLTKVSSFEVSTSKLNDSTASLKQQIHLAIQLKDDTKTIALLKKLLVNEPTNQIATKKLAAMLFSQGKMTESKQVILDGIALYPETTELRMMLARLYVQQKNLMEALNILVELDVSASIDPNYVSFRASLAKKLERFEQAKSDYKNLLASQPSNAKWWLGLAVAEEKLGNQEPALKAYKKVDELNQLSAKVANFVQQRIEYLAGVI